MNLRANPVDSERHEPHPDVRVEPLDRLHEADVALLDQVADLQTIAGIAAGDVHHEPKVRKNQAPRGVQVVGLPKPGRELEFLGRTQHRNGAGCMDVLIEAADRGTEHEARVPRRQNSGCHRPITSRANRY